MDLGLVCQYTFLVEKGTSLSGYQVDGLGYFNLSCPIPGKPRIDAPGALHYIMARRIEGGKIFRDDKDRDHFLERLENILRDTETSCYAWTLIPNHFHEDK